MRGVFHFSPIQGAFLVEIGPISTQWLHEPLGLTMLRGCPEQKAMLLFIKPLRNGQPTCSAIKDIGAAKFKEALDRRESCSRQGGHSVHGYLKDAFNIIQMRIVHIQRGT